MKRGKEALKELYKFEGFSFEDIFKEENRMIIKQKKGENRDLPCL